MNLWYVQVYMIFSAWCFHRLRGDSCTTEACLSCGPLVPIVDLDCTVEEVASSQSGISVYKLSCYVTTDNCSLISNSEIEYCIPTSAILGCFCSLHVSSVKVTQGNNGSLTFVSGWATIHTVQYGLSMCKSDLVVTELCETEKNTTKPLLDFLNDNASMLSCRCYGTNCSRNITATINVQQQPNPNSVFTTAVSGTSQMVLSSLPGSSSTSSVIASPASGFAGGFV